LSIRFSTPRMHIRITSPSNPESATTTLLPPPSTKSGRLLECAHCIPASSASVVATSAKYLAGPPMPRVVIEASGTFSLNELVKSSGAADILFKVLSNCVQLEPYIAVAYRVQYHHIAELRRMTMKNTIAILVCMIFVSSVAQALTHPHASDGK